jgi:hypothetical protein
MAGKEISVPRAISAEEHPKVGRVPAYDDARRPVETPRMSAVVAMHLRRCKRRTTAASKKCADAIKGFGLIILLPLE